MVNSPFQVVPNQRMTHQFPVFLWKNVFCQPRARQEVNKFICRLEQAGKNVYTDIPGSVQKEKHWTCRSGRCRRSSLRRRGGRAGPASPHPLWSWCPGSWSSAGSSSHPPAQQLTLHECAHYTNIGKLATRITWYKFILKAAVAPDCPTLFLMN